jgi:hypothetical protein|tara:strand:- start:1752 stop:2024 length:273 start_codon:yes stop_codon:yes gene_type:complete
MADESSSKDKRNTFQRVGGHTLVPYLLKASGFDKAATNTGYPDYLDDIASEKKQKELKRTRPKSRPKSIEETQGFSRGGQVKGSKFKGTF